MGKYNFKSMIRSAARKIDLWSPARREAIVRARVPGLKPNHVVCAECGLRMRESLTPRLFAVDHIVPASEAAVHIHSWDDYFRRLDVPAEGRQVLCNPCHDAKTAEENVLRRTPKKKVARKPRKKYGQEK